MPTGYGVNSTRNRPKYCRTCGKPATDERTISFRGYCMPCAAHAANEAARQMQAKSGPHYDQWLRSTTEALRRAARA